MKETENKFKAAAANINATYSCPSSGTGKKEAHTLVATKIEWVNLLPTWCLLVSSEEYKCNNSKCPMPEKNPILAAAGCGDQIIPEAPPKSVTWEKSIGFGGKAKKGKILKMMMIWSASCCWFYILLFFCQKWPKIKNTITTTHQWQRENCNLSPGQ